MKKIVLLVCIFAVQLTLAINIATAETTIKLSYSAQLAMPFSVERNSWVGYPLGLGNGLGVTFILSPRWSLGAEPGVYSAVTAFQPNPQLGISASFKITDKFSLGIAGLYRYLPNYSGGVSEDGHLFGISLAPGITLGPVVIVFPIGTSYNTVSGKWGGLFSVKLVFPFAKF